MNKIMKPRIFTIAAILMLVASTAAAQTLDDALRYSRIFYQGTARFNGMSGAFTALGGDISAVALNPAAAGVFRSTEIAISPNLMFRTLNTSFNGFGNDKTASDFKLGQVGVVSSLSTGRKSGLTNLNFAYTLNRTNNFYRYAVIDGISDNSSMADYWALQANGYNTWELEGMPWVAYDSYMIDTLSGQFTEYASIFSYYGDTEPAYGQKMKRTIDNYGYTNEHNIAIGANLGDKIYLGAAFGITGLSYTSHYLHSEIDDADIIFDFEDFSYTDHFVASGSGFNFKLGAIVRPVESLRLGLSFTTPTVYTVDEWFYNNFTAFLNNDTPSDFTDDIDYSSESGELTYRYRITTPYRINAGIAYQVGNFAILSADYEFIDYATARLHRGTDGYDFFNENEDLKSELGSAGNLRLGAEVRLGSLYLRGGYSHYGSSFREGTLNESATNTGYSAGLGFRQNKFYIDLSMVWLNGSEGYMLYPDDPRSNPLYRSDPVYIDTNDKYLSATLGFKF
jgi:hypothetical protein